MEKFRKLGGIGISSSIYLVKSVELTLVINSSYDYYEILVKLILWVFRHMSSKILNFIFMRTNIGYQVVLEAHFVCMSGMRSSLIFFVLFLNFAENRGDI